MLNKKGQNKNSYIAILTLSFYLKDSSYNRLGNNFLKVYSARIFLKFRNCPFGASMEALQSSVQ